MRSPRVVAYSLLPACWLWLVACAPPAPPAAEAPEGEEDPADAELRTTYGDLLETLSEPDLERWRVVQRALRDGFDRICGDTICSGDYPNLSTVRLRCSSTAKALKLKDCTWVLGGSIGHVEPARGQVQGESRVFTCKIPVRGTAPTLLDVLLAAGDDALNTPLPLTEASFYDGLVKCFEGVVGPPVASSDQPTYVELADYFWNQGSDVGVAWSETRHRLREGFDQACGDSFCEGEYPDITALGLACSVEQAKGHVSSCVWSFAAADTEVDAKGALVSTTQATQCPIEVNAAAADLAAALNVDDPLHAPLPGRTTSLYDALVGCL